jgi:hypothetical protein
MIHGLPPEHVALLCLAAFCGGTVDAIAGGGGATAFRAPRGRTLSAPGAWNEQGAVLVRLLRRDPPLWPRWAGGLEAGRARVSARLPRVGARVHLALHPPGCFARSCSHSSWSSASLRERRPARASGRSRAEVESPPGRVRPRDRRLRQLLRPGGGDVHHRGLRCAPPFSAHARHGERQGAQLRLERRRAPLFRAWRRIFWASRFHGRAQLFGGYCGGISPSAAATPDPGRRGGVVLALVVWVAMDVRVHERPPRARTPFREDIDDRSPALARLPRTHARDGGPVHDPSLEAGGGSSRRR